MNINNIKIKIRNFINKVKVLNLFFNSLNQINFKKENFILNHIDDWHQLVTYKLRNKEYIKVLEKMHNSGVISINLSSYTQLKILQHILKKKRGITIFEFSYYIIFYYMVFLFEKVRLENYKNKNIIYGTPIVELSNAIWDISIKLISSIYETKEKSIKDYIDYVEIIKNGFYNTENKIRIYKNDLIKLFLFNKISSIIIPQFSYKDQIFMHLANNLEVNIIMFDSLYSDLTIFKSSNKETRYEKLSLSFKKKSEIKLDDNIKNIIDSNIKKRVFGEYDLNLMGYMKDVTLTKSKIEIPDGSCVLFLHCFLDAPNAMIENSNQKNFNDYFEMTLYIIDLMYKLNKPLIIKPHPQNKSYFGDKYLLDSIKNKIEDLKKDKKEWHVDILDFGISNSSFIGVKDLYAITGRGTVMLECGFLGIPICMTSSHEWEKFDFVRKVKNKGDILEFILNPYNNYDPKISKEEVIKLQYYLENKRWKERPSCIDIYNTKFGILSNEEIELLYEKRLEV